MCRFEGGVVVAKLMLHLCLECLGKLNCHSMDLFRKVIEKQQTKIVCYQ
jgi:hypothetical protein